MPAIDAHRIFLSTVTKEFGRYRVELARRFEAVSVKAVYQEEFEYADVDLIEKLYQLIVPCDVVIHFVGAGAGAKANPAAVTDFLQRCKQRGDDFLSFWRDRHDINRSFFDTLSYTQWEAVIAIFLGKHFMAIRPKVPAIDGHPPGEVPFVPTPTDDDSQKRHLSWLGNTIRRYPQIIAEQDGSYLGDAFDKTVGFLLRLGSGNWRQIAQALQQSLPEQTIAPSRLVSRHTGPESTGEFLGREDELKVLDDAWNTPATNVFSIIAWGGVGKTALLAEWIERRFRQRAWQDAGGLPDPLFYFDWTFYDQGTRADDATQASAASVDSFFDAALRFFGDPEPQLPGKGDRLARFVQAHRTLLVLDGLEPLQYPPNHPQAGQINDPDLHALLATLAQRNPGLCVLTSRQTLVGLHGVGRHDLDDLPEAVGIRLLRKLGVVGTDEDLALAVRDYFGHALSLIVLGRFLFVKGGDIRLRDTITLERCNERRPETTTRNARHVLEAYEQWLGSAAGRLEDLQALRLTGLFERPASPECLDALLRAPAIPGLTDQLVALDPDDWNAVLHRLHAAHLILLRFPPRQEGSLAPRPEARHVPLDSHPLIREFYAQRLRDKHENAYRQAHSRLFDHLCETTPHRPDTLDGLQPLYQAVVHGCLAGRQQEARAQVYRDRILRGTEDDGFYSTKKLGAVGADLGTVAAFFETPWSRLSPNLSDADQAWLLNEAAYRLRALGRLTEAVEPMRESMEMYFGQGSWGNAASAASNLSQLEVTLGRLGEAIAGVRRVIDFADRSGDAFQRMVNRTTAADALHQSGELDEARRLVEQAEAIQRERQPQFVLLYSLQGFRYCELILAEAERVAWREGSADTLVRRAEDPGGQATKREEAGRSARAHLAEAERRATLTLEWTLPHDWLLDIAFDHLTLARVNLYRALLETNPQSEISNPHLFQALDGIRKASDLTLLPKALLTAALHHHRILGDEDAARRFLDEARQIAERGPMPLYLADVHLHRARLFHNKDELTKARELIEKHGYGRRKGELEDAEAASVNW